MRLDRKISIYQPVLVKSSSGMETKTYTLLTSTFAQVRWEGGSERPNGKQRVATLTCVFGIRFRSDLKETMVIEFENQFFDITNILPKDRRQFIEILAEKKDNDWSIPL